MAFHAWFSAFSPLLDFPSRRFISSIFIFFSMFSPLLLLLSYFLLRYFRFHYFHFSILIMISPPSFSLDYFSMLILLYFRLFLFSSRCCCFYFLFWFSLVIALLLMIMLSPTLFSMLSFSPFHCRWYALSLFRHDAFFHFRCFSLIIFAWLRFLICHAIDAMRHFTWCRHAAGAHGFIIAIIYYYAIRLTLISATLLWFSCLPNNNRAILIQVLIRHAADFRRHARHIRFTMRRRRFRKMLLLLPFYACHAALLMCGRRRDAMPLPIFIFFFLRYAFMRRSMLPDARQRSSWCFLMLFILLFLPMIFWFRLWCAYADVLLFHYDAFIWYFRHMISLPLRLYAWLISFMPYFHAPIKKKMMREKTAFDTYFRLMALAIYLPCRFHAALYFRLRLVVSFASHAAMRRRDYTPRYAASEFLRVSRVLFSMRYFSRHFALLMSFSLPHDAAPMRARRALQMLMFCRADARCCLIMRRYARQRGTRGCHMLHYDYVTCERHGAIRLLSQRTPPCRAMDYALYDAMRTTILLLRCFRAMRHAGDAILKMRDAAAAGTLYCRRDARVFHCRFDFAPRHYAAVAFFNFHSDADASLDIILRWWCHVMLSSADMPAARARYAVAAQPRARGDFARSGAVRAVRSRYAAAALCARFYFRSRCRHAVFAANTRARWWLLDFWFFRWWLFAAAPRDMPFSHMPHTPYFYYARFARMMRDICRMPLRAAAADVMPAWCFLFWCWCRHISLRRWLMPISLMLPPPCRLIFWLLLMMFSHMLMMFFVDTPCLMHYFSPLRCRLRFSLSLPPFRLFSFRLLISFSLPPFSLFLLSLRLFHLFFMLPLLLFRLHFSSPIFFCRFSLFAYAWYLLFSSLIRFDYFRHFVTLIFASIFSARLRCQPLLMMFRWFRLLLRCHFAFTRLICCAADAAFSSP